MPDWAQEVRTRLSSLRLSPTREREIVDELSQHLEDRWRELVASGASPDEATQLTLALFKGSDVLAKSMAPLRQAQGAPSITPGACPGRLVPDLAQDLRYAARALLKQRAFAFVAVLTLALGIGATTTIFSVVYGVLLKPLPFDEPDRLVAVHHRAPGFGASRNGPQSPATYFTYRESARVFEDIALWSAGEVTITRSDTLESGQVLRITDGLLALLRVRPVLGELVQSVDDVPGAPNRVVLTFGYWQRVFGGAPNVIGQPLTIDGAPHDIIGVLPASFRFLDVDPEVVLPLRLNRSNALTGPGFIYRGVARLKPGVTLGQAHDDIARMIPLVVDRFPLQAGITPQMWEEVGLGPDVRPLSDAVIGELSRPLWILMGSVGIVLLMACANVANLLLVRTEARQRELAVRAALGASRARIARALLAESLVLGLAGGAFGVLLARAGIGLLRSMAPAHLPRVDEIGIDGVVLLFTLTVSVATAFIFGLLPVSRVVRLRVAALKDAGQWTSDGRGRHGARSTLVVAQVAVALVLLIISGLMVQTVQQMKQIKPGYVRPGEVQTFSVQVPAAVTKDRQQVARVHEQIVDRLLQVPGVNAVGLSSSIAMDGGAGTTPVFVEDHAVPGTPPARRSKLIGAGYFETMGNPVVAGRAITWTDIQQLKPVVVISENLAREYWHEPSKALGKRIGGMPGEWFEIVGVVGNERADGLNQPAPALVYWPMADTRFVPRRMAYAVRSTRVGAPGFLRELQQAAGSVSPQLPLVSVQTLDEIQADSMAVTSFTMVMLTIAASVAIVLGVVGMYGVIAYIAAQRVREIGIRMALGARTGDVRRLFLRHGLALTFGGIALGIGAAILTTRVMSALLFGVGPLDLATYVAASAGLAAVGALATYLPARRASAIDPVMALRSDI